MSTKTDLIIIGGGAAGLMAGAAAGELGLKTLILERKHKPGRKLLMCGNARCNLTTNISGDRMVQMLGDPVGPFLAPALEAFSPATLQRWFAAHGLKTVVKAGNKVYPHTESASDVLNFFLDRLRETDVSLSVSSPVKSITPVRGGFCVSTDNFSVEAKHVLIATGGISYPKTGSVGDGQAWAEKLEHTLESYRPGLVGFEVAPAVLKGRVGQVYERVTVDVMASGKKVAETRGVFEIEKWGAGGTALSDASRIVARQNIRDVELVVHMDNGQTETVRPKGTRPIKEAMVTVGGVSLRDLNPQTMESKKCKGLFFAGEVMDVDGPTGGYNLQAAFSSARLAVAAIGKTCGKSGYAVLEKAANKNRSERQDTRRPRNQQQQRRRPRR